MDSICQDCISHCYPDDPRKAYYGDYKSLCQRCWRYEEAEITLPILNEQAYKASSAPVSPLSKRVQGLEAGFGIIDKLVKEQIEKGRKPVKKDRKGIELEHT